MIDEHLVDVTLVAHLQTSHVGYYRIFLCYFLIRVCAMSGGGVEVEQRRLIRIQALELHFAVATAQIECLFVVQLEHLIACNHSSFAAYIEDSHLTAGQEIRSFQRINRLQQQGLPNRHRTAHNHSVVHGIHHVHFILHKHVLDQKIFS